MWLSVITHALDQWQGDAALGDRSWPTRTDIGEDDAQIVLDAVAANLQVRIRFVVPIISRGAMSSARNSVMAAGVAALGRSGAVGSSECSRKPIPDRPIRSMVLSMIRIWWRKPASGRSGAAIRRTTTVRSPWAASVAETTS